VMEEGDAARLQPGEVHVVMKRRTEPWQRRLRAAA
jgi:hypothetical protein